MSQSSIKVYDENLVLQMEVAADLDHRGVAVTYVAGDWFSKQTVIKVNEAFTELGDWLTSQNVPGWEA